MPDDERILGFTNRWYAQGIKTAVTTELDEMLVIRHLTPPLFVATKFEAYSGRGAGDLMSSRDAEDILLLVDGREELSQEIIAADPDVRCYICKKFTELLKHPEFDYFLEGNIRGPSGRPKIVYDRLVTISCSDNC